MTLDEAIQDACASVGIARPKAYHPGRWAKTDTLDGKSGRGDGRLMVDDNRATAWNWQTGEKHTVWLQQERTPQERRDYARQVAERERNSQLRAYEAAKTAARIIEASRVSTHPYLAAKGFRDERVMVIDAESVRSIGGDYLVPDGSNSAIVIPAKVADRVSSAQLIWEDGTKRFLGSGKMEGASHRLSAGVYTWICEGFATGLSLRTALAGLKIKATILCCFSASNLLVVSRQIKGRAFVAADNDKPLPHFDNLGTGEHYAKETGLPYGMPPGLRTDFNDMHQTAGIFAVQRALTNVMSGRSVA